VHSAWDRGRMSASLGISPERSASSRTPRSRSLRLRRTKRAGRPRRHGHRRWAWSRHRS
jgi:hypothetical protein